MLCAAEHLRRHINDLSLDVYAMEIAENGAIRSSSTDHDDDMARCSYYPPLKQLEGLDTFHTIRRSELFVLKRFGPSVDSVS